MERDGRFQQVRPVPYPIEYPTNDHIITLSLSCFYNLHNFRPPNARGGPPVLIRRAIPLIARLPRLELTTFFYTNVCFLKHESIALLLVVKIKSDRATSCFRLFVFV